MATAGAGSDVRTATARAVERARAGRWPALLVVMARHDLDLTAIGAGASDAADGAVVVGTSTSTVYAGGGRDTGDGRSPAAAPADVVVMALGGPGLEARAGISDALDPFERGARAVSDCGPARRAHSTVLMLPNGTDGHQQTMVRGVYSELGPSVPLVGGGSDGDLVRRRSWQLLGSDVVENGLVVARLDTDRPLGVGVGHGLSRVGEPMVVTDSDGLVIRGLDGRPALDVYLERLGVDPAAFSTQEALAPLGFAHPLSLVRRRREEVRTIIATDLRRRTMEFVSEVPTGSMVSVMAGGPREMHTGAVQACQDAVAGLGGAAPAGMVVFSCIARRELLSPDGRQGEAHAAREAAGGVDVVLNYSCGEVARVSGAAGCHNQTVVALAI